VPRGEVSISLIVPVTPMTAYQVWSDLERYPEWMDHLVSVRRTGRRTSAWTMRLDDGSTTVWGTETTVDRPGEELAWSSVDGVVVTYGRVRFEPLESGRTKVTVTRFHAVGRGQDRRLIEARFGDPVAKLRRDLTGYVSQLKRHVGSRAKARRVEPTPLLPSAPTTSAGARTEAGIAPPNAARSLHTPPLARAKPTPATVARPPSRTFVADSSDAPHRAVGAASAARAGRPPT
jgi:hypothetical protein